MKFRRLKYIVYFFLLPLLLFSGSTLFYKSSLSIAANGHQEMISLDKNFYVERWKEIKRLEEKGLTKSALAKINEVYHISKKEHNSPQIVKSLIIKAKLESHIEENAFVKTMNMFTKEVKEANNSLKPLMHSIIGELYWKYYTSNRWRFQNRTTTANFDNEDINTWDLKKIILTARDHYLLSIENIEKLKETSLESYYEILVKGNSSKYRPFLYDFLMHRAIDFFGNEEAGLTSPVYKFNVDKEAYFLDAESFSKITLSTNDSISLKFYALQSLQNLVSARLKDKDPTAFIDAELKRFKFVRRNATFPGADSLFYQRLKQLHTKFRDHISVVDVLYELANFHYERGNKYNALRSSKNKWELKKAMELCTQAFSDMDNSFYGAKKCQWLAQQIKRKELKVITEKVNSPGMPFRGNITSRNVPKVYFKVVKMDFKDYRSYKGNRRGMLNEQNFQSILKQEEVRHWELNLEDDGDFQSHSGEFKIDALPLGFYVLLTATTKDFTFNQEAVAVTPIWISNIAYLNRKNGKGENQFIVMHRESGKPLKNVNVRLYNQQGYGAFNRQEEKNVKAGTTDEEGVFTVSGTQNINRFYVEFSLGKDKLDTRDSYYQYKGQHRDIRKRIRSVFFLDREIYRPGQTMHFKGIVLEQDEDKNSQIKPRFNSTVTLYDVNHQKVSTLDLLTNEYGTFSGSFIVPNTGLNGQMHIGDKHGSKYFSVEEYKRPKFEVAFKPIEGSYKINEKVSVVGEAKTYSGAAIDEGTVAYRVVRKGTFPYRCFYRWGFIPQSPEMEIVNGTTTTNDKGQFYIDFIAHSDKTVQEKYTPRYTYTVYADVTDINGETHSTATFINVSSEALNIAIGISDLLNKNQTDSFTILTTNLNGEHEAAEGDVKMWRLKEPTNYFRKSLWAKSDRKFMDSIEYKRSFPYDVYNEEDNKYKWDKSEKVYASKFNTSTAKSLVLSDLLNWEPGEYVCEVSTKDRYGKTVEEVKYFTVYDDKAKKCPINSLGWFTAVKNTCEPGEKAIFLIGSAANDVSVLYEVEHEGGVVSQKSLHLKKGEQRRLEVDVEEKHRGNFQVHFTFIKHSRSFVYTSSVTVPYTNKQLNIEFETFRNKLLPGQEEEWKLKIKGANGEKVAAEMVATLYDASLDAFRPNRWGLDLLKYSRTRMGWKANSSLASNRSILLQKNWNKKAHWVQKNYDQLNWFGYQYWRGNYFSGAVGGREKVYRAMSMEVAADMVEMDEEKILMSKQEQPPASEGFLTRDLEKEASLKPAEDIQARKNFNETAFFAPHLATNEHGEVEIKFTIPETLTRWKFMGLAHTKDLKTGIVEEETVTQKELMVYPNAPRFFRENDKMVFSTKITNLSNKSLSGEATIFFYDALTMQLINDKVLQEDATITYEVEKEKSTSVHWNIAVPEGYAAITYKVVAQAGKFSDGEEMAVPVLTNRMLVTEALPLPIRGKQTKTFTLDKLQRALPYNVSKGNTLKHHKLTLEFTSNPAWYAIQSLPYLMEYPYECAEQTFSRFYANSIATHVVNSNPKIAAVFERWKNDSPETFLSNLEKNQELKSLIIEETPWVISAQNESERKKRVGLLFDLNKMKGELRRSLEKLRRMQGASGAWSWFKGMLENRYVTQHIVTGLGHLDHLNVTSVREDGDSWKMTRMAVKYLDNKIREDYAELKKHKVDLKKMHIGYSQIQYLYARSYFKEDIPLDAKNKEAYQYYLQQAQTHWLSKNRYMQGMIALALHRENKKETALEIMASLRENAIHHDELGMYWKKVNEGYYWYQAPIETQALLIEAFDEVTQDDKSVEAMKVWLLKQKQTQDWRSTKATTEACYALLLRGTDLLADDQQVEIQVGGEVIDPNKMEEVKVEAGTGYFKVGWNKEVIRSEMGTVKVTKNNDGVAWGALYWQYFEQLDKITQHKTPLQLNKKLFVEKNTDAGPVITPITESTVLSVGDKVKVRIELRVDRNMEYIHMKDMRAAGLEPLNVFSGYRYQDGLGYYQSTKDASTNFFFAYLAKGTYVFEYPLRINAEGDFSNGITTIQSMYAPEFISHSEGIRMLVGKP